MRRRGEEARVVAGHPVQGLRLLQDRLRHHVDGEVERIVGREERDQERRGGGEEDLRLTMGKARELKRRADSLLEEVFRSLFEEIDTEKLRQEVDTLKASAPEFELSD